MGNDPSHGTYPLLQGLVTLGLRIAPAHCRGLEPAVEEFQPPGMSIGVCDVHSEYLHVHDQHVCIGGADVVPDEELAADALAGVSSPG